MTHRWPNKDCSGAHCHVRNECKHHALPIDAWANGLVYPPHPIYKREDCRWFDERPWGEGKDTVEID